MSHDFVINIYGPEWNNQSKVWLYRFNIRHEMGDINITVGVNQNISEDRRIAEAKILLKKFVETSVAAVLEF